MLKSPRDELRARTLTVDAALEELAALPEGTPQTVTVMANLASPGEWGVAQRLQAKMGGQLVASACVPGQDADEPNELSMMWQPPGTTRYFERMLVARATADELTLRAALDHPTAWTRRYIFELPGSGMVWVECWPPRGTYEAQGRLTARWEAGVTVRADREVRRFVAEGGGVRAEGPTAAAALAAWEDLAAAQARRPEPS
jgi:hypothetical protein